MDALGLGVLSPPLFLKNLKTDAIAGIRFIPYGAHITLFHAPGLASAEITYIGYVIMEFDCADWAEFLTGTTGNAQSR